MLQNRWCERSGGREVGETSRVPTRACGSDNNPDRARYSPMSSERHRHLLHNTATFSPQTLISGCTQHVSASTSILFDRSRRTYVITLWRECRFDQQPRRCRATSVDWWTRLELRQICAFGANKMLAFNYHMLCGMRIPQPPHPTLSS